MRFQVKRTSVWDDEIPPCPEAVKGTLSLWDYRTFKSPEEHDAHLSEKWADRGTEHDFIYGPRGGIQGIKRRLEDRIAWFVEVASLTDLMAFREKHGDLIVTDSMVDRTTPTIEIYDGYRE